MLTSDKDYPWHRMARIIEGENARRSLHFSIFLLIRDIEYRDIRDWRKLLTFPKRNGERDRD